MRAVFSWCLVLWCSCALAHAEEISARVSVEPQQVTVGDSIRYRITVSGSPNLQIRWPAQDEFGEFEILQAGGRPTSQRSGSVVHYQHEYQLAVYALGERKIPALNVAVQSASGESHALMIPEQTIRIISVRQPPQPGDDIRPIQGPVSLPRAWWVWVLLALAAAAGITYCVVRWIRTHRQASDSSLDPAERARRDLRRLLNSDWLKQEQFKPFHLALTEIIRTFLGTRYGFDALDLTTGEIVIQLRQKNAGPTVQKKAEDLLSSSDLVKFAKAPCTAAEARERINQSLDIIDWATKLEESTPQKEVQYVPVR